METFNPTKTTPATGGAEQSALAMLERIDRRLARLEATVERVSSLEQTVNGAVGMAMDTFDDMADRMRARGVDVDERLHAATALAERLTSPEALKAITLLLDRLDVLEQVLASDAFATTSVNVVAKVGDAIATASSEPVHEVGLWGTARAMSNHDVKRAMGFLLRVAQVFGQSLDGTGAAPRLGEGGAR